jgi:hypothetical protein
MSNQKEPTIEEIEAYNQKLIAKFKQDTNYELRQEFGRMLFKHIDSFTPKELERYNELKSLLKEV